MISLAFHDKPHVKIRAAQAIDATTRLPVDEYRLTVWSEVTAYEGLPQSVRHTFTRAQLLALQGVIAETIGGD
jgi:hypothetical protein